LNSQCLIVLIGADRLKNLIVQQLLATNQNTKFAAVVAIQLILTMIKAGRQEDATSPAAFLFLPFSALLN